MAVGFPASYSTEIELTAARSAARDAVISTCELLDWELEVHDPYTWVANVGISAVSWGETVTVSLVDEGRLYVRSSCSFQVFDWGKNRRNVDQFLELFSVRVVWNSTVDDDRANPYLDETGDSPLERLLKNEAQPAKLAPDESTRDSP